LRVKGARCRAAQDVRNSRSRRASGSERA
jgi:hypothetical protein